MGRLELGTKCTCTGCQERFYDLNRKPAICPKCGAQQPPERPRALRPPPGSVFGARMQRGHMPPPAAADEDDQPEHAADIEEDAEAADDDDVDDVDEIDDTTAHSAANRTAG